jgi:hypothetical protein
MSILNIPNPAGSTYQFAYDVVKYNTNMVAGAIGTKLGGLAASALGSLTAIPQVTQFAQSAIEANSSNDPGRMYTAVPYTNLNRIPGVAYQDFRSRKGYSVETVLSTRVDGAALATRNSTKRWISILYASLSASPVGAYSAFNREADGIFGAGWGDHGNVYALRNDFTAQSHVATVWKSGKWAKPFNNPLTLATPFRGDRVQVIDYKRSVTLGDVYRWNTSILGADVPNLGITQDFIKFFFTGPKLAPGNTIISSFIGGTASGNDDSIVFRAAITSLTDSFNPSWTPVQMIGRADANQHYTAYSRDISLTFTVYATDRDEMKPIWRKLNALAGYTAPTYNANSISLEAPWLRFTIGDLYFQQPAIITSLSYTLHDTDTTWEINIEHDEAMMQAPKKIEVNMQLTLITNELPQKDGKFYTLAKQFASDNSTVAGNHNWLSDFRDNPTAPTRS